VTAGAPATGNGQDEAVIWHDVECGAYEADLPTWGELADESAPVLELGCGTGRVALWLARRGVAVTGLDREPALIEALRNRAAESGLEVRTELGDASDFGLEGRFGLVLAPMQLIQLLESPASRAACLRAIAAHLLPGGRVALAIVEELPSGSPSSPPLPDVRELDGFVYSSLPLGALRDGDSLLVGRLRQVVDPAGSLTESRDELRLTLVSADSLEKEARAAGLRPAGRQQIEATESHVGSTVVLLEA
jgi:SAM-dependent methyltransferase